MQIEPNDIHIWSTCLACLPDEEAAQFKLLSPDEKTRATRFHFPQHRRRFTLARATLRKILSQYTGTNPEQIEFAYNQQQKPRLPHHTISFNLSHSEDMAIFAFTHKQDIGVDIEKMTPHFNLEIAKRYFTPQENAYLQQASIAEQSKIFYTLWAKKEALIKATGKGLQIPLDSFSVSPSFEMELIPLEQQTWSLFFLNIDPAFAAAVATNQKVHNISQWVYNSKNDLSC